MVISMPSTLLFASERANSLLKRRSCCMEKRSSRKLEKILTLCKKKCMNGKKRMLKIRPENDEKVNSLVSGDKRKLAYCHLPKKNAGKVLKI